MRTVIFGGAGGVGSALAKRLTDQGRKVFLIGRSEDKLSALAEELGAEYAVADVTDQESVDDAIKQVDDDIDGLAYAIGTIGLKPLQQVTRKDLADAYEINVVGAIQAIQAAKDRMADQGSIVLFSSVAAQRGFTHHTAIAGAKGAVEAVCRTLAAELAPKIRVNAVAMSLTDTPLAKELTSNDKIKEGVARAHPLGRIGDPDDVAGLAAYLLSKDSGWVTGAVFNLDGGRANLA